MGDTFKRFRNSWFNLLVKTDPLSLDMVVGKEVCEKMSINASQTVCAVTRFKGEANGYLEWLSTAIRQ